MKRRLRTGGGGCSAGNRRLLSPKVIYKQPQSQQGHPPALTFLKAAIYPGHACQQRPCTAGGWLSCCNKSSLRAPPAFGSGQDGEATGQEGTGAGGREAARLLLTRPSRRRPPRCRRGWCSEAPRRRPALVPSPGPPRGCHSCPPQRPPTPPPPPCCCL